MSSTIGNPKKYQDRIVRDIQVCGGEPVFKGTRVTLRTVLASLAAGDTAEEILSDFPSLNLKISKQLLLLPRRQRKRIFRSLLCPRFDENQDRRKSSPADCSQAEIVWA